MSMRYQLPRCFVLVSIGWGSSVYEKLVRGSSVWKGLGNCIRWCVGLILLRAWRPGGHAKLMMKQQLICNSLEPLFLLTVLRIVHWVADWLSVNLMAAVCKPAYVIVVIPMEVMWIWIVLSSVLCYHYSLVDIYLRFRGTCASIMRVDVSWCWKERVSLKRRTVF
jgi:hypothetical protein